jgi:hypothetical protein
MSALAVADWAEKWQGVDLLKLFTRAFSKLGYFINATIIFLSCEKI